MGGVSGGGNVSGLGVPIQTAADIDVSRLIVEAWSFVLDRPDLVLSFALWQLVLLYTIPVVFWDFELGILSLRN